MFKTESIVGKPVDDAVLALAEEGMQLAVIEENGVENFAPKDYNQNRVRVVIKAGKVAEIRGVG